MDQSPEIRSNVRKFQTLLKQGIDDCKILVNRKTGGIEVPQKIHDLEERLSKERNVSRNLNDWKEIRINISSEAGKPHFGVKGLENLEKSAQNVIRASLEILNEGKVSRPALPEEELTKLPGWAGKVDRLKAEQLLGDSPVGTYLLREADPLIQSSVFHMAKENHLTVHPFLLTVVEDEEKISDTLLLKTEKGWLLYVDDPNLEDKELYRYFPSVASVLVEMSQIAKYPLTFSN